MPTTLPKHRSADPEAVPAPRRRWRLLAGGSVAVLVAVGLASGCNHKAPGGQGPKTPEVIVTTPIRGDVADYQDFTGRLNAVKTVDIRAHVTGYIKAARFKEGDPVHEGDVLFEIDPSQYRADLDQAEANLKLAEADSQLQQKNAVRAQRMYSDKAMAREDYETTWATAEKAKATVNAMEAARDRAKLFWEWTRVTSPVSGRISYRYVDPGNLITADTTMLTTVVTEDPLWAYFDVDEHTYLDLDAAATPDQYSWFTGLHFPVLMKLANENDFTRAGFVDFVDNRVTPTTGTVRMRGVFENPRGTLKPGLFARIRLPIGKPYSALLIPDEAVLSDQGKNYVFVVSDKNQVKYRAVDVGQAIDGLRVIKKGLADGERVIITGQQRVRAEMSVEAKLQAPPKPPESKLAKLLAQGQGSGVREQGSGVRSQESAGKRGDAARRDAPSAPKPAR